MRLWKTIAGQVLTVGFLLAALRGVVQVAHEAAQDERASWPKTEAHVTVPPPRMMRVLSLGYNELWADIFWAKMLVYYGDGMLRDSTLSDVEPLLELVNALDPWFHRPYEWGALATVFRQHAPTAAEYRSSVAVLERGVKVFPDDWQLHWMLGLRYYLDLKSDDPAEQRRFKETGAEHIERAMRAPNAPPDLSLLASSMRTELGQRDRALAELREMILATDDEKARAKLVQRYQLMTSADAGDAIERAKQEFNAEWLGDLPYVPPSFYVLLGSRAPALDLDQLTDGPRFDIAAELDAEAADEPTDGTDDETGRPDAQRDAGQ